MNINEDLTAEQLINESKKYINMSTDEVKKTQTYKFSLAMVELFQPIVDPKSTKYSTFDLMLSRDILENVLNNTGQDRNLLFGTPLGFASDCITKQINRHMYIKLIKDIYTPVNNNFSSGRKLNIDGSMEYKFQLLPKIDRTKVGIIKKINGKDV